MKYALITGASRGLGRAIAIKLAKEGYPVIINYQSNDCAAEEVKNIIEGNGGQAELMKFDVCDKESVEKSLTEWADSHPEDYIAYVVNNAGITKDNLLFMMSGEDWHKVINTTLDGFYNTLHCLLPKMMQRKHGGAIVNISSLSGQKGMAGQTNYSAAKAALIGATKSLALEVASRNVRVNAVAPGFIETDMTRDLPKDELKKQIPMNRFGHPEEVADLVYFLISEKSSYITGEVIAINGGLYT